METDTFPRRDVQEWLSGLVCLKIDAGGRGGHPLAEEFRVQGFPTLVLLDPLGKVLRNEPGAPVAEQFVDFFSTDAWNAAVDAVNGKDLKGAAPHLLFLRKWFKGTRLGKQAEEFYLDLEKEAEFKAAYDAAQKAHDDAVGAARKAEEERAAKEQERRAKARAMKAEADDLFKKYLKTKAYDLYRKILAEYPDLPEADEAEAILKKNKQKLAK